jgi:prevent-host-death family protein
MECSIHEAKTHFSKLLAKVAAGEEVIITSGKAKKPVAKLVAAPEKRPIRLGWLKGKMPHLEPDSPFFDPLPEEELRLWNGEGD